jgi:hypothetical protein
MTEYTPLTVERFHRYLIGNNICLRLSDMEEILRKAEQDVQIEIKRGNLKSKSEPVLYQFAYEPALAKLSEVNEQRILYAAKHGTWSGEERRTHNSN